jgi:O-acetyl-ADP-ribose deacetylase (regulator of RNase III)
VAVDGFYGSSPEIVRATVVRSLELAASLGARKVALTALACGYGRMTMADFARAVAPLCAQAFAPIAEVVICLRDYQDAEELAAGLKAASR